MDRREAILARILELAEAVPGVATAKRNQLVTDDMQCPAIMIFDGDENAVEGDPPRRPANTPRRVEMRPVITLLVSASSEIIGTEVNTLRAALLKAMVEDTILIGYTLDRVGFRYEGAAPVVENGRVMQGAMQLQVSLIYLLNPAEL